MILYCFSGIILFAIAWQDFKFRAVYWWLFPLLFIAFTMSKIKQTGGAQMFADLTYNSIFLAVQVFFLTVYFSIKERKWVNIFEGYFGLGDLFFLLSIAPYFSLVNYLLFYIVSLFIAISLASIRGASLKIPLAGQQAVVLAFVMIVDWMSLTLDLTSGTWADRYFGL